MFLVGYRLKKKKQRRQRILIAHSFHVFNYLLLLFTMPKILLCDIPEILNLWCLSWDFQFVAFFFSSYHAACEILVPNQWLNPSPWQWKLWVLITELQWKSLNCFFIYTSFLKDFNCTDCFYRNTSFSVMGGFNHFNTLVIVQWGNKPSALATGMKVTQRLSNRGFRSPWSICLQPLLSAQSANSRVQPWTSNMAPFPRESASCLVMCCLNYPASTMEEVVPYFTRWQLLWMRVFLPCLKCFYLNHHPQIYRVIFHCHGTTHFSGTHFTENKMCKRAQDHRVH